MRKLGSLGLSFVMALTMVAAASAPTSAATQPNWIYNSTTHHYYAVYPAGLPDDGHPWGATWADAEAYAKSVGGDLVTIDDQAENDWLVAIFGWYANAINVPLFIGLNDVRSEGRWVWASGKRVTYTNWMANQPDNWKGYDPLGEHVAVLSLSTGQWDDISGRFFIAGIIEVPGHPKDLSWNTLPVGSHDGNGNIGFQADPLWAYADACYANGWAFDPDSPKRDVTVRIMVYQDYMMTVPRNIWQGPAHLYRADVQAAGYGNGTSGFYVDLRGLIEWNVPYVVRVQAQDVQTGEWVTLDGSPRVIYCLP